MRPLVLLLPKMSGCAKIFKNKSGKNKNNKLVFLCINDNKLLEKYKTIWTKIEDLKSIKLDALAVFDDKCVKTKIRTYGNQDLLLLLLLIPYLFMTSIFS